MRVTRLLLLVLVVSACSAATKHKVLSVLFDGVPEPGPAPVTVVEVVAGEPEPAPPEIVEPDPAADLSAAELAAGGFEAIDQLPLRPVPKKTAESWQATGAALEEAATWEEALRLLPVDATGGADWVAAVNDGLSVPQLVLDAGADAGAPFTLDTLLAGFADRPASPFLDLTIEMVPDDNPLFAVSFPHSSHTLFLACSSCHPGVKEWDDVTMDGILAGQACGQCHGRVSFDPEVSCARCHPNLAPAAPEAADAEVARARQDPVPASPEVLAQGEQSYRRHCSFCHGEDGDGKGRFAPWLRTQPRDFTSGTYKFVTVIEGPARDLDLFRTITRGVPGTSMPPWLALPYEERWALVHYVKKFSDWFDEEAPREPISITPPPAVTAEVLDEGRGLFRDAGCNSCHGEQGNGDGPSANSLRDNWGEPIRPFNFASGRPLKSGPALEDIFRTVTTGLPGTPMPGFSQSLSSNQIWALVGFVSTLRGQAPAPFAVKGDIVFQRNGTNGSAAAPAASGGDEAQGSDGDGDFWGVAGDEGSGDGGGDFWGVGDNQGVAADNAGGEDFWGVGEDEGVAADNTGGGEDFWGVGEDEAVAADNAGGGEDFWGVGDDQAVAADTSGGDDFWGVEDQDAGGDDFWGDDGGDAEPAIRMASAHPELDDPIGELPMPPATFPHWLHRARLKCANCHPRVFEMKAGANPINMDAMRAGLYCAKCHNGKIAWEIGFTNCPRCHQARSGLDP